MTETMTGTWDLPLEPLRIELALSDVMFDLDPRWQDWTSSEAAPA